MSRAEAAGRITRAAITLGTAEGVGALSLQAIAHAAGVSKALLLYHFDGKSALLDAVALELGQGSTLRLRRAASVADAMDGWRTLARDEATRGELALLAALTLETATDAAALLDARAAREAAAASLATAVLAGVQLQPRVPPAFLGRLVLRQLDGLTVAARRSALDPSELENELDAFALALLALGR